MKICKNTQSCPQHFLSGSVVKNLPAKQATQVRPLCWDDLLEKDMATRCSILAWEISRSEGPGEL